MNETSKQMDLSRIDANISFDKKAKEILSKKSIFSIILHETLSEFKNVPIREIMQMLDEENEGDSILRDSESYNREGSKDSFMDIVKRVRIPATDKVQYVDLEPQSAFLKGQLFKRSLYYTCKIIVFQDQTEFSLSKEDYENMRKANGIWIVIGSSKNVPEYAKGTISAFRMIPEKGEYSLIEEGEDGIYKDMLEIVIVCLGEKKGAEIQPQRSLLRLLNALFLKRDEKEFIETLKEYGIEEDEVFEREVKNMCTLSQGIYEIGIEEGEAIGIAKGETIGRAKGEAIGIAKGEAIGMSKNEQKNAEETYRRLISTGSSEEYAKMIVRQVFQHADLSFLQSGSDAFFQSVKSI